MSVLCVACEFFFFTHTPDGLPLGLFSSRCFLHLGKMVMKARLITGYSNVRQQKFSFQPPSGEPYSLIWKMHGWLSRLALTSDLVLSPDDMQTHTFIRECTQSHKDVHGQRQKL